MGSVSAQDFAGLPWQLEVAVIICALSFTILTFVKPSIPVLGVISSFFWIYAAIASSKVVFYTQDGTQITDMSFYHLIYLFGFTGVIMIAYSIYLYVSKAKEQVEEYQTEQRGKLNKTI